MTANELANKLKELHTLFRDNWKDRLLEPLNEAQVFLRQQAQEIAMLKQIEGIEVKVVRELTDEEIREIGKPFLGFVVDDELEFARAILKKASEK